MTPVFDEDYDRRKEAINIRKHGIDFVEARRLWADPNRIDIAATSIDERRFMSTGVIGDKVWSAVYTYRHGQIRLISVHRATTKQERRYRG